MAIPDKALFSPDGSTKDLPPHLDILQGGHSPLNMHPSQVFREYPALSMIAQIVTDYIMTEYAVQKDELSVFLHQDSEIAAITFDATPANDGSMNRDVQARIVGAFHDLEKSVLENALTDIVDVSPQILCIGGNSDKSGMMMLLHEFAQENGFHIGPTPEGSRLKSIGAFTLDDIQAAVTQEKNKLLRHLGPSFRPVAQDAMTQEAIEVPPPPHAKAQDIAANLTQMFDLIIGEGSFDFIMTPRSDGYRYILWPESAEKAEAVQKFFDDLQGETMPEGVTMVAEDYLFRLKDEESFKRLYDFTVEKFGTPVAEHGADINEDAPDADAEQQEDGPFFWNRAPAQTAPEMVCAILFGLSRYHFGLEDTDWEWSLGDKGDYTFAPLIDDNEGPEYARLMNMAQELAEEGGAWHNLFIGSDTGSIVATDIRMVCSMLDRYCETKGLVLGPNAIDSIKISTPPENYLFETDTILSADPSLIMGLGDRTYSSRTDMLVDVEKLLQAIVGKKFIAPHTTDDVYKALTHPPIVDRPKPEEPHV